MIKALPFPLIPPKVCALILKKLSYAASLMTGSGQLTAQKIITYGSLNGLPLVVIECKDANHVQANPMHEAFIQLRRYTDQREETNKSGLKEGDPKLFYTN